MQLSSPSMPTTTLHRASLQRLLLSASTLVLLCLAAASAAAQNYTRDTIEVEGIGREFLVSIPSSYNGTPMPLVIMLHGTSGDGEKFFNISGWKEKGEAEGIITVFPSALYYRLHEDGDTIRTTKWMVDRINDSLLPGQTPRNDVLFMRTMLDSIEAHLAVDTSRIYVSGFSNGGQFAAKLMVDMSDRLAAVHVAAGTLSEDDQTPDRLMPVMYSVGEKDDRFISVCGVDSLPLDTSILGIAPFRGIVAPFLLAEQMDTVYTVVQTPLVFAMRFQQPRTPGNREVNVLIINDAFHMYPNGTNHPIVMANIVWEFFKQYRLEQPAGVDDRKVLPSTVAVDGRAAVLAPPGIRGEGTLRLYSVDGSLICSLPVDIGEGALLLPLDGCSGGAYLLELSGMHKRAIYHVLVP